MLPEDPDALRDVCRAAAAQQPRARAGVQTQTTSRGEYPEVGCSVQRAAPQLGAGGVQRHAACSAPVWRRPPRTQLRRTHDPTQVVRRGVSSRSCCVECTYRVSTRRSRLHSLVRRAAPLFLCQRRAERSVTPLCALLAERSSRRSFSCFSIVFLTFCFPP